MTLATPPPMSIQIALSVGDPVKNLDRSELNELVAWTPMMMSTTPPISRAIETILFIVTFQKLRVRLSFDYLRARRTAGSRMHGRPWNFIVIHYCQAEVRMCPIVCWHGSIG
jgi:hypothetical protein